MKQRRIIAAVLLAVLISTLCGCSSQVNTYEEDMRKVHVPEISWYDVERESVAVSDDDLHEAVQLFLEMNLEPEEDGAGNADAMNLLTDKVATGLGYGSADELESFIKETMIRNRSFEEIYYQIISKAAITGEIAGITHFLDAEYRRQRKSASEAGLSMGDYLRDTYGYTKDEFMEENENFYYEMITVGALAQKLNIYPTKEQYNDWIVLLAEENQVTPESLEEVFGHEYLIFSFNYDQIRDYFMDNIPLDFLA